MPDELEALDPIQSRGVYVRDMPLLPPTIAPGCPACRHPRRSEIDQLQREGVALCDVVARVGLQQDATLTAALERHGAFHVDGPAPDSPLAESAPPAREDPLSIARRALRQNLDGLGSGQQEPTASNLHGVVRLLGLIDELEERACRDAAKQNEVNAGILERIRLLDACKQVTDDDGWQTIGRHVADERDSDAIARFLAGNETKESAARYDALIEPLMRRAPDTDELPNGHPSAGRPQ